MGSHHSKENIKVTLKELGNLDKITSNEEQDIDPVLEKLIPSKSEEVQFICYISKGNKFSDVQELGGFIGKEMKRGKVIAKFKKCGFKNQATLTKIAVKLLKNLNIDSFCDDRGMIIKFLKHITKVEDFYIDERALTEEFSSINSFEEKKQNPQFFKFPITYKKGSSMVVEYCDKVFGSKEDIDLENDENLSFEFECLGETMVVQLR